jgi:hypothetical protein
VINEYPGRKRTSRRPSTTLTGVSFSGGIRTNSMQESVRRITSVRSFGRSLSMIYISYFVCISLFCSWVDDS